MLTRSESVQSLITTVWNLRAYLPIYVISLVKHISKRNIKSKTMIYYTIIRQQRIRFRNLFDSPRVGDRDLYCNIL